MKLKNRFDVRIQAEQGSRAEQHAATMQAMQDLVVELVGVRSLRDKWRGDVDRLENSNTAITYPILDSSHESLIREVTPGGEIVWELRSPAGWSIYRSERVATPTLVRAP